MCKSIKKSCFVIVLSFMSFAFFSGDVSSDIVRREAATMRNAPSNSVLAAQAKAQFDADVAAKKVVFEVTKSNSEGQTVLMQDMTGPGVNQRLAAIRLNPNDKITVQVKDSTGKPLGPRKEFRGQSPITVDILQKAIVGEGQ